MSENEELEEEIQKGVKNADRVIEIKHTGIVDGKEFEKIKSERDELKSQLGLIAERAFRDEKEAVLEQYPESRRDEIDDLIGDNPDVLEQVKADLKLHGSQNRKAPSGKASLPIRQNQQEAFVPSPEKDDFQQYVDELYQKAKLSSNPAVRSEADSQIEKLFESYERGMSENLDKPFKTVTTQCLQCGAILSGNQAEAYASRRIACPYCGYGGGTKGVRNPKNLTW